MEFCCCVRSACPPPECLWLSQLKEYSLDIGTFRLPREKIAPFWFFWRRGIVFFWGLIVFYSLFIQQLSHLVDLLLKFGGLISWFFSFLWQKTKKTSHLFLLKSRKSSTFWLYCTYILWLNSLLAKLVLLFHPFLTWKTGWTLLTLCFTYFLQLSFIIFFIWNTFKLEIIQIVSWRNSLFFVLTKCFKGFFRFSCIFSDVHKLSGHYLSRVSLLFFWGI